MACFYGESGYWRQQARFTEKKKGGMRGLSRDATISRIKLLQSNFFSIA
jgi:hypothetical protein